MLQRTLSRRIKDPYRMGEKFSTHMSNKEFLPGMYKEFLRLNNRKTNHPTINGQGIWTGIYLKKVWRWPANIYKVARHRQSSGKCKSKPDNEIQCHARRSGPHRKDRKMSAKCWQGCGGTGPFTCYWWEHKMV